MEALGTGYTQQGRGGALDSVMILYTMQTVMNTSLYNWCIALLYIRFTAVYTSSYTYPYTICIGTIYCCVYAMEYTKEYSVCKTIVFFCVYLYIPGVFFTYTKCISGDVFQLFMTEINVIYSQLEYK